LEILNAGADLSRRAVVYTLQGLSFREYLNMTQGAEFPRVTLPALLKDHAAIAKRVIGAIRPLAFFEGYLRRGYYPYFREQDELYYIQAE